MGILMSDIIARVTSQTAYASLLAGDKFGFLSAKQYGAEGDDVTDDSVAILALLTAVNASTYKAPYFPAGVYVVDGVTVTSTHFSGLSPFGDNASFRGITTHIQQIGVDLGVYADLVGFTNSSNIVGALNELKSESVASVMTTRGDLVSYTTQVVAIPTGTLDQYLVCGNTSDALPKKYLNSPQKIMTARGDMIFNTTDDLLGRIPASTGAGMLGYNVSSSAPEFSAGTAFQTPYINNTTNGVEFAASARSVMTGIGDMITSTAANVVSRVARGNSSEGGIIQAVNGLPSFQPKLNMTVITSTSGYVWSPPISGKYKVTLVAGGGAGGIVTSTAGYTGAGGGAGGASILTTLLSSSESITITIGAGGALGTSTGTAPSGGQSLFGTYITCNGGVGGSILENSPPSAGGFGSNGDINMTGGNGAGSGRSTAGGFVYSNLGGASYFGGTGSYGSGGIGGMTGVAATTQYKFTGTNGVCIIEY